MVSFHFQANVFFESIIITKTVHRYRVVNDKVHWRKRIHFCRISPQTFHRFAHGGKIDHRRHTGKILHQNTSGSIGNFTIGMGGLQPMRESMNIIFGNGITILPTKQIFQQHF